MGTSCSARPLAEHQAMLLLALLQPANGGYELDFTYQASISIYMRPKQVRLCVKPVCGGAVYHVQCCSTVPLPKESHVAASCKEKLVSSRCVQRDTLMPAVLMAPRQALRCLGLWCQTCLATAKLALIRAWCLSKTSCLSVKFSRLPDSPHPHPPPGLENLHDCGLQPAVWSQVRTFCLYRLQQTRGPNILGPKPGDDTGTPQQQLGPGNHPEPTPSTDAGLPA